MSDDPTTAAPTLDPAEAAGVLRNEALTYRGPWPPSFISEEVAARRERLHAVMLAGATALEQIQALRDKVEQLEQENTKLREWVKAKLASPHQDGEDGHRDGFCQRCADFYVEAMAALDREGG